MMFATTLTLTDKKRELIFKTIQMRELVEQINNSLGVNILENKKSSKHINGRSFLYYYIYKKIEPNKYKVHKVLMSELGLKKNRATVWHNLKYAESYIKSEVRLHKLIAIHFPILHQKIYKEIERRNRKLMLEIEEENLNEETTKKKEVNISKEEVKLITDGVDERFIKIFQSLQDLKDWQVDDIEKMIKIRLQSYKWKYSDKCEIIEGSYSDINNI